MLQESEYHAVLRRSPAPLSVIGYYCPDGEHGRREEVYRVEVTQPQYDDVVTNIRCKGGTDKQKREALFLAFKPQDA